MFTWQHLCAANLQAVGQTNLAVPAPVECQAQHVWCVLRGAVGLRPISVLHVLHAEGGAAGVTGGGPHNPGRVTGRVAQQRLQLPDLGRRQRDISSTAREITVGSQYKSARDRNIWLSLRWWNSLLCFLFCSIASYKTCACAVCDVPGENGQRDWWQKLPADHLSWEGPLELGDPLLLQTCGRHSCSGSTPLHKSFDTGRGQARKWLWGVTWRTDPWKKPWHSLVGWAWFLRLDTKSLFCCTCGKTYAIRSIPHPVRMNSA